MAGRKSRHQETDAIIRKTLERGYRDISFNRAQEGRDRVRDIISGETTEHMHEREKGGSTELFPLRETRSGSAVTGRMLAVLGTAAAAAFLVAALYVTTFLSAPAEPYIAVSKRDALVLNGDMPFAAVHYAIHDPAMLTADNGRQGSK